MKKPKNKLLIGIGIIFAVFMLIFAPISAPQGQAFAKGYGFMVGEELKTTAAISAGANDLKLIVHTDTTITQMKLQFGQTVESVTIKYKSSGQLTKIIGVKLNVGEAIFSAETDSEWQNIVVKGQFDYDTKAYIPLENLDGYYIEIEILASSETEMTILIE